MDSRKLRRINRIEGAEQVELAVVVSRRVAQNCHLNGHAGGQASGKRWLRPLNSLARLQEGLEFGGGFTAKAGHLGDLLDAGQAQALH